MDPSALARFATSCGAFAPLEIAIEYHDGAVAAVGTLQQPFALVGRDSACDIALDSPEILPRTAFLQVVGGQVFVGDLGTRSGLRWHHGRHPFGWMYPLEPIQVGPFALRLLQPASPHPAPFGATFHPLVPGPDVPAGLPPVEIEFITGQADRARWSVNRVLTLVGSSPDCKIHLADADIAPRHCYLLHAHDGLWVVDLTGRNGVWVNGQSVRFARLGEGDELRIGRFVIGCTYPYPSENDGLICFDDVPRPAAKQPEPIDSLDRSFPVASETRRPPKTDFDSLLPPHDDPPPANGSADEDTDEIHGPANWRGPEPQPLSDAEFALLVPVDERGVADSGASAPFDRIEDANR